MYQLTSSLPAGFQHNEPVSSRAGIDKEQMIPHGFRAVARTILDEVLGVRPDYIEHQLAHAVRDPNGPKESSVSLQSI